MAKKKFYAVKNGRVPGIYQSWDECKEQVSGFSNARYKSFAELSDAENYMEGTEEEEVGADLGTEGGIPDGPEEANRRIRETVERLGESEAAAFVDGSYDVSREKSGFGAIVVDAWGEEHVLSRGFTKEQMGEEFIHTRNVAAELQGVMAAVNWAISHEKTKITVFYDYTGIEEWATGRWQVKNNITRQYVQFIEEKREKIHMQFVKVPAHSGVEYNERADALAKQAIGL